MFFYINIKNIVFIHIHKYYYSQKKKTCITIEKQAKIRLCIAKETDMGNKYNESVQPH